MNRRPAAAQPGPRQSPSRRSPRVSGCLRTAPFLLVSLLALAGCGGGADGPTVVAASSLTNALPAVIDEAEGFEDNATLAFAGSATIATQIETGRSADIVITANRATMDRIEATGLVSGSPVRIAVNELIIGLPADNPAGITSLADLTDGDLRLSACATAVPCGEVAQDVIDGADLTVAIDSFEPNVRAVASRLETGSVDAGFIYRSDAVALGDRIATVEIDPGDNRSTTYFAALLRDAHPGARPLFDHLRGAEAQRILAEWGFTAP